MTHVPNLSAFTRLDPEFYDLRVFYNRALPERPLAIVRLRTEGEVSAVILFCLMKHIPISVRSGGHDFLGRSLVAEGIIIDMRAIDSIVIAPDKLV